MNKLQLSQLLLLIEQLIAYEVAKVIKYLLYKY